MGRDEPTREVTRLLQEARDGDAGALDRLMPHVYGELRRHAARMLQTEAAGHTLQPTALVNETYLRLVGMEEIAWSDRGHFYAVAATCMRRILVDHARRRRAAKRGGSARRVDFDHIEPVSTATPDALLALDEALDRLEHVGERKARVAQLRLFAGLGNEDVGRALGISRATVEREWRFARAWLHKALFGGLEGADGAGTT